MSRGLFREPAVVRIVLFGSVAMPLKKEVPRFRKFQRAGIKVWHECADIDLAVWVSDLHCLETLRKATIEALKILLHEKNIGIADHQMDIFIMEPGTNRYLGRLCRFNACPKGKPRCHVPGCGATPFLRQHLDFTMSPESINPRTTLALYERASL